MIFKKLFKKVPIVKKGFQARELYRVGNTLRKNRKKRKRERLEQQGIIVKQKEPIVKEFIKRKAAGALKSSTVGVAGLIVSLGVWITANPAIFEMVPESLRGVALAVVGLLVAIARLRTAGDS